MAGTRDRDRIRSSGGSGSTSFGTIYGQGIWDYEPNPVPEDDRDLRRYINDELQKIRGVFDTLRGEAWHTIGDTGEPSFDNSWIDYGGTAPPTGFYLDVLGKVNLQGGVKDGTSGLPAFRLPAEYINGYQMNFAVINDSGVFAYIQIEADGDVVPYTSNTDYVSLDGISFSI